MVKVEPEVSCHTNVRTDVVFEAFSKVVLEEYLTLREIKGICRVLAKRRAEDIYTLVVTQIENLSLGKKNTVQREKINGTRSNPN